MTNSNSPEINPSSIPAVPKTGISFSSVETQKELRLAKAAKLKASGHDPYTPDSKRDFTLGFVKFWFDFVHKFDLTKITEDLDLGTLDYFLTDILFPESLVQMLENKIYMRRISDDLDFDALGFENEFERAVLDEARALLPDLSKYTEDLRVTFKEELLPTRGEDYNFNLEDLEESPELNLKPNQNVILAGRIKSKRVSGKIAFATIEDESCPEGFQFIFKKDSLDLESSPKIESSLKANEVPLSRGQAEGLGFVALSFSDFKDLFDEGDYIQASGILEYSNSGEPSLFVENFEILTKTLRPLPEKLEYSNIEARYLDRVADIKMDTKDDHGLSVREIIRAKAKYWQIWREEMLNEGFLEVECPIFESTPGGADAKPFSTFYNELDQDMYLRISLELPLKKLIAGGFEKVFEIGRIFRNEGSDPTHLQEYTQIEWYWAYSNYFDAMPFTVRVYRRIAQEILGKLEQIDYNGNTINWSDWLTDFEAKKLGWQVVDGWPAIPYFEAVRYFSKNFYKNGEIDLEGKNYDQLLAIAANQEIEIETGTSIANLIDKIYKKVARPFMVNPMFLILQPVDLEPLAKRDPQQPELVHRWQIIAGGQELGKCFSELNDPTDQYQRLLDQQSARDAGDDEAQFMNEDYVKALEYGLPPLSGFGMSERMVSFLLGKHIRECVTFPHIRTQEMENSSKSKSTMVAHAILLDNENVPLWSKLNAAAHLSASLGAREGKKLIWIDHTNTKDGEKIPMNIQHAILMKTTAKSENILKLKQIADLDPELEVTIFTTEMRDSSNDLKVKEWQESKNAAQIGWLGILIFGDKKKVEKLTAEFNLAQ